WEGVKKRVKKAMRDMAAELLRLYAERKARPGHAFAGESPWQREFEEAFEYEGTRDQEGGIAEGAADMAGPRPHGPAHLRGRRLRQDRGGHARGHAGRARRQAGGAPRPYDRPRVPALEDVPQALRPLPREGGDALALPHAPGDEGDPEVAARGRGRRALRHAPPALEGPPLPRSGGPRDRRGAALRGRGQGEAQAPQDDGGLPDPLRDADPAHAADGAGRHPRHVGDRDAAQGPPRHRDPHREVPDGRDRGRDPRGAGPRRPGVLRPQS